MTHPSLERRPTSAQIAKEVLEKPQQINKYSQTLRQGKTVNTFSLFENAIGRSTEMGTLTVGACAGIYSTFIFPVLGTIFGGFIGLFLGLLLGLGNGIIVGIITRLWFFPLTNPKLHRQVLTAISILLCTSTSIVYFFIVNAIIEGIMNVSPIPNIYMDIIFLFAPSLIAGLSMGASSKSIARWYQIESGL
jgi:uncharacterized membrane protein